MVSLPALLGEIRACRHCEAHLPLGPRPILRASAGARLLIVGQAPGTRVHESGVPWDDPSGERLRDWLGVAREIFYDEGRVAIVPCARLPRACRGPGRMVPFRRAAWSANGAAPGPARP